MKRFIALLFVSTSVILLASCACTSGNCGYVSSTYVPATTYVATTRYVPATSYVTTNYVATVPRVNYVSTSCCSTNYCCPTCNRCGSAYYGTDYGYDYSVAGWWY